MIRRIKHLAKIIARFANKAKLTPVYVKATILSSTILNWQTWKVWQPAYRR